MGIKSLVVTVMSAKDLHDVNVIHRMDPYVIVSLSDGSHKQYTRVHENGGTSPRWDSPLTFPIDEASADLTLVFEIMTKKTIGGATEVGWVKVPIAELLEKRGDGKTKRMSCSVSLPSEVGKTQGVLLFTYKFGEELPAGCGKTHQEHPSRRREMLHGAVNGAVNGAVSAAVSGVASWFTSG